METLEARFELERPDSKACAACTRKITQMDCTGLEPVTFSVSWRRASQLRQQS